MEATFLAVRAIGTEFARQLWVQALIGAVIGAVLLIGLLVWLTSQSAWWWLLGVPIGIAVSVAAVLLLVFWLLMRYVRPLQTVRQKQQVKGFVGKLQFVSEITSTPKFIILFRTIRSIAAPKSDRYLQEIFESRQLGADFKKVVGEFC